ncbi:dipeptidase [Brevibacillus invocatus]|uniref:Membrane dipeptidase n=1 Tax=Brevibacillus invocatus TaxID=173959 RepID=A0A3M8C766_9BACL|nr:dipeptidase [Brevibacillus invocatus]MCM3081439.1 dipeptidase [Brevibacillus invocatus]MCM3431785.1 dipeptidase [Brevibacillus invocatus]RNB71532.1 membrane dipeptidase [Brevibacillus invocatus]
MKIIDLHCDALLKLWYADGKKSYENDEELDTNKLRLLQGGVKVQGFAIYTPTNLSSEQRFHCALDQIYYFQTEVLAKNPEMKQIKEWIDIDSLKDGEIGAILTLEGVEPIGNDLKKLHLFYQLGVRAVGLTWNYANLAADGADETRNGGLTLFGKEIVNFHNEHKILTDVSHLCEGSFWDVMEYAKYPFASHSNARALCDHQRNLRDEQAKALFEKGGTLHVTYVTMFINEQGQVGIPDLIRHVDHFCSLGGVRHLGLGSDFDGITTKVEGLEHAGVTYNLINELLKHYSEEQVRGFAGENFLRNRPV